MKYLKVNGETYKVETSFIENGKVIVSVWDTYHCFEHYLKVHYRPERTWDDHMGNTPCGYYVNLPLPYTKKTKRFYI